jgi:hypothetical protein
MMPVAALGACVALALVTAWVIRRDYRQFGHVSTTAVVCEWLVYTGLMGVTVWAAWSHPFGLLSRAAVVAHLPLSRGWVRPWCWMPW